MRVDLPLPDLLTALVAGGGAVLGLAVGVAVLRRRQRGDGYLGGFLVAASLSMLAALNGTLSLYRLHPHLYITPFVYTFALGPLLYGAVRSRLEPSWRLRPRDRWHAALPLAQAVQTLAIGLAPLAVKDGFWQTPYAGAVWAVEDWIFPLHFAAYALAAHSILRRAEASPEAGWLRRLVGICLAVGAVVLAMEVAFRSDLGALRDWAELGAGLVYAGFLYWTAVMSWRHVLAAHPEPAPRRETYGMTEADLAGHADRVRRHVEAERPYLDPDLTLGALAAQVGLDERALSYVLNAGMGVTYADYVNGLRVAEAQRQLHDPDRADAPVLEVGLASGFASKATFNRAFKRATGQTPTAYRAGRARLTAS